MKRDYFGSRFFKLGDDGLGNRRAATSGATNDSDADSTRNVVQCATRLFIEHAKLLTTKPPPLDSGHPLAVSHAFQGHETETKIRSPQRASRPRGEWPAADFAGSRTAVVRGSTPGAEHLNRAKRARGPSLRTLWPKKHTEWRNPKN